MELDSAEIHRLDMPLAGDFTTSHGTKSSIPSTLVVLTAADGTRGIGTSDPSSSSEYYSTREETVDDLADAVLPAVLEREPDNPNQLLDALEVASVREAALAAETAYLDLYGKRTGQSISDLLGGRLVDAEPLNGWVGIDDPDAMASEAADLRDRGFEGLKIKLAGDAADDIERVRAVCDAVGDEVQVRADANTAYDVGTAVEVAEALEGLPLAHFEQPIPGEDIDGLKRLTESTSTTIMADEAVLGLDTLREVLEKGAADRVKLKIMRLGGVAKTRFAIEYASLYGVSCVVGHGFCTTPGASAELQVTATHDNAFRPIETVGPLKMADEPFSPRFDMSDGTARLPDAPGLGVGLDDDRLGAFSVGSVTVDAAARAD